MRNLRYELELPGVNQRELFRFHEDPSALPRLSPPEKHVKVIEQPKVMKAGARVIFSVSPFGVPIRWVARMDVWEPPVRFVDVQEEGPFASWRHEHVFADGLLVDLVSYAPPLRFLGGGLVDALFVKRDVEALFRFRHRETRNFFASRRVEEGG